MSSTFSASLCFRCARFTQSTSTRAFSTISPQQTQQAPIIRRKRRDAYAVAQARARKAANQSRQQVLLQERAEQLGDPVRGITTRFVASFDNPPSQGRLNFFVGEAELQETIKQSDILNNPSREAVQQQAAKAGAQDAAQEEQRISTSVDDANGRSKEALRRISSLAIGNTKDRQRVNAQRCISKFGRHHTDKFLPPKPSAAVHDLSTRTPKQPMHKERLGEDTGSPEVQIAILTAKIRSLANGLEAGGRQDKRNHRNLRLMVHRRQKQLRYLRSKERGGPRWQNLISTLGLTDGMWRGEITLPRWQVAAS